MMKSGLNSPNGSRRLEMSEEYGNIADGFLLSQSEIDELRKSKRELTDYAKQKLKELIEKQDRENTDK